MKNYYLNPSTRDLIVHDAENDEVIIIQSIKSVKVWMGGEMSALKVKNGPTINPVGAWCTG